MAFHFTQLGDNIIFYPDHTDLDKFRSYDMGKTYAYNQNGIIYVTSDIGGGKPLVCKGPRSDYNDPSATTDQELVDNLNSLFSRIGSAPTKPLHVRSSGVFFQRIGYNSEVPDASGFRDIWPWGAESLGDIDYPWPTSSASFRIRPGGNPNDSSSGSGAREITIVYLDASGDEVTETLSTNGASASSATSSTGRRINEVYVSEVGSYGGSNVGRILIEHVGGDVLAMISPGASVAQMSQYTVPTGKTAYLTQASLEVAVDDGKDAHVIIWARERGDIVSAPYKPAYKVFEWERAQGVLPGHEFKKEPVFPEHTDIWASAQGNGDKAPVYIDMHLRIEE